MQNALKAFEGAKSLILRQKKGQKVISQMAKTYLSTVKYIVKTSFTIEGIVDKHDIIGAIFGQSEGLIGEEMDLKELQKNGKLGRIEVDTQTKSGKTIGILTVPSSLDRVQTSILAAAVESVDKVGPCNSRFKTETIEDARQEKRKTVTERAKELLMQMSAGMPETQELAESIREKTRTAEIKEIGRDKIPIGPDVDSNKELILVEGRADVINLVKHGIKNVAGVGGAKASRTVENLARSKEVTLFVDGDRGGEIIARQLGQAMKIDHLARAPDGKEVEELTLKEILGSLRKKNSPEEARQSHSRLSSYRPSTGYRRTPRESQGYQTGPRRTGQGYRKPTGYGRPPRESQGYRSRPRERSRDRFSPRRPSYRTPREHPKQESFGGERPQKPNDLKEFGKPMQELEGSLKARFLNQKMETVKEVSVRDLLKEMEKHKEAEAIVLDGIITKRLLEEAEKNKVKQLVGVKRGKIEESKQVKVATLY